MSQHDSTADPNISSSAASAAPTELRHRASLSDDAEEELVFCVDEIWENQRKVDGVWAPAPDRAHFTDRLGRGTFRGPADVPTFGWRVVDDWSTGNWLYGKTFASLELKLAQGSSKVIDKGFSTVRWRAYVRQRNTLMELKPNEARELIGGWLGCRQRRGTWKSRFFTVIMAKGASFSAATAAAEGDEDDSSQDSDVAATAGDDVDPEEIGSPPVAADRPDRLDIAAAVASPPQHTDTWAFLVYFRREFDDVRASFQSGMDPSEILKLPRKHLKITKLTSRHRIEPNSSIPTRFQIRQPSGLRKVYNCVTSEQRDRWVEALSSIFDGASRPRASVLATVMRRGQHELRLRRSLMPWRRRTSLFASSSTPLPAPSALLLPAVPTHSKSAVHCELFKDSVSGSLGLNLSEHSGGGVYVKDLQPSASGTGMLPSPGDCIISVNGESMMGLGLASIKEALAKAPRRVPIEYLPQQSNMVRLTTELMRDPGSGSLGITLCEHDEGGVFVQSLLPNASAGSKLHVGDQIVALAGEPLEGLPLGLGIPRLKQALARLAPAALVLIVHARRQSESDALQTQLSTSSVSSGGDASKKAGLSRRIAGPQDLPECKPLPPNDVGLTKDVIGNVIIMVLLKLAETEKTFSFSHCRGLVAAALHLPPTLFDSVEWRTWFRDFLDGLCEDCTLVASKRQVTFHVVGCEANSWTPMVAIVDTC